MLHNKDNIKTTDVIGFPYSDHNIVITSCNFDLLKNKKVTRLTRKLNGKRIIKVTEALDNYDFTIINKIIDPNDRWLFFKKVLTNILDDIAPLKKCKVKRQCNLPWYDTDCIKAERKTSKLYVKMKKSNYLTKVEDFKLARQTYQTMLRDKKTAYFLNTTPKDFKNSIEFWDLHSQHMKLRSDSSSNISINSLLVNDIKITDKNKPLLISKKLPTTTSISSENISKSKTTTTSNSNKTLF